MHRTIFIITISALMLIVLGCSSNPTGLSTQQNPIDGFTFEGNNEYTANHHQWGVWTAEIDLNAMTSEITVARELSSHFNITTLVPAPEIYINFFNPGTGILDVDVVITNPYSIEGRDVRLIINTDSVGHILKDDYGWTALYDITGGLPINPFKAVGVLNPARKFLPLSQELVNLQIYLPGGNPNISFTIDASYPGNCEEPYEISDFSHGVIYGETGSSTTVDVTVLDWQHDVESVYLYCPDLIDSSTISFTQISQDVWESELVNETGAGEGEYIGYIMADSFNSGSIALYNQVVIEVTRGGGPNNPHLISTLFMLSKCHDVVVKGNYAYVADDWGGMKIFDVSDTSQLVPIGYFDFGTVLSVAINGDYLYLGCDDTFTIVDISNPVDPQCIGDMEEGALDMVIDGDYAYLAAHSSLVIVNISDPYNPIPVGVCPFSTYGLTGIAVSGNYAYVSADSAYLYIVDISDLENPIAINEVGDSHVSYDVEISGDYAYLAAGYYGMKVVSIANPEDVYICSELSTGNGVYSVAIVGDIAYLGKSSGGLYVVNIENPFAPEIIGEMDTIGETLGIDILGHCAFLADDFGGFATVDITVNESPFQIGVYSLVGSPRRIFISNDYAYLGTEGYMQVIDISDPMNPFVAGSSEQNVRCQDMDIENGYLYIAAVQYGFQVFNLIDPVTPIYESKIDLDGFAYSVKVRDNIAYVTDLMYGLNIIDVSDPTDIELIGFVNTDGQPHGLDISGDYAFVADGTEGLTFIDISEPTMPEVIGRLPTINMASYVDVYGDFAFVIASDSNGSEFYVMDVTDPTDPDITSICDLGGNPSVVVASDSYAYISDWYNGLLIYDVLDPYNAVFYNSFDITGPLVQLDISGMYAYCVVSGKGLDVVALR
jgi:hypothetical protein